VNVSWITERVLIGSPRAKTVAIRAGSQSGQCRAQAVRTQAVRTQAVRNQAVRNQAVRNQSGGAMKVSARLLQASTLTAPVRAPRIWLSTRLSIPSSPSNSQVETSVLARRAKPVGRVAVSPAGSRWHRRRRPRRAECDLARSDPRTGERTGPSPWRTCFPFGAVPRLPHACRYRPGR
jgi:hypothetical protein